MVKVLLKEEVSFLEVAGVRVRFIASRQGDGIPLLLTCPWPESIFAFNFIWADMCRLGPVIAVDLPGFGQSEASKALMSPEAMGDFVMELMPAIGLTRAHVVAPDVGTLAVLFAASKRPDLFESIVAGSGAVSMDLLGDPLAQIVASRHSDFEGGDGGDQVVALVSATARVPIAPEVLEDYRAASKGQRWNDAAEFVRAYPAELPRLAAALSGIKTPVLAISGSDDPFVPPSNGEFLRDNLPHCKAEVVEAGHFVWEDASTTYARLVSNWIGGGYRFA
ncbi:alpha/beta hydrolase [Luteibacter sp. 22Crub2.1]|uniref:alpha/beta fold hydrolase n=1 Tax=Luteibacter sp. 22Crub2.1 TaxID=1283288 RepID=UPI0009A585A5|nr:alpha/beta hydrolase [Luteibacter sp. 22Crub2.1]